MPTSYVIVEAILLITAVIAASAFSTTIYSMLNDISQLQQENVKKIKKEVEFDAKIIFVSAKEGDNKIKVWIKNTGREELPHELIKLSDIYLKTPNKLITIPYGGDSPSWTYTIINDMNKNARWSVGETIEITITLDFNLDSGDYFVKFVAYTGRSKTYFFSV